MITDDEHGKYAVSCSPGIITASQIYPDRFTFHSFENKQIGVLILSDPMRFEGNADESAEVFLKAVCSKYNERERELAAAKAQLETERRARKEDCRTIARWRNRAEAAEKDAKRYRWLRDNNLVECPNCVSEWRCNGPHITGGPELGTAIDAAIESGKGW